MDQTLKALADYGMGAVCLAVLIVLHIYNVRVTLPMLAQDGRKQIDELVTAFRMELAEERRQCHEDHRQLNQGIEGNQKAITDNQIVLVRLLDRLDKKL